MGAIVAAIFGSVGAWLTNYLLGDKLHLARILMAVGAGIVGGLIVTVPLAIALYLLTHIDLLLYAIIGSILGPPFTALAAWRWRRKELDPNDLRAR